MALITETKSPYGPYISLGALPTPEDWSNDPKDLTVGDMMTPGSLVNDTITSGDLTASNVRPFLSDTDQWILLHGDTPDGKHAYFAFNHLTRCVWQVTSTVGDLKDFMAVFDGSILDLDMVDTADAAAPAA